MSYRELYCSKISGFLNSSLDYQEAKYIILGVPLDFTSSFIGGSKFGPEAIRRASLSLESFNMYSNKDAAKFKIADIGDIDITYSNLTENIVRIENVTSEIFKDKKIPILLGGEHTITLGPVRNLRDLVLVCFDAHLDLRDEYCGSKLSHATVMRRIFEMPSIKKIIFIGTRAVSSEEFDLIQKEEKLRILSLEQIEHEGIDKINEILNDETGNSNGIYMSIDMDVFDPSIASSVGNPEPDGLNYKIFKKIINSLNRKIIGFDIVEIVPRQFVDLTAIYGAKIIFEILNKIDQME